MSKYLDTIKKENAYSTKQESVSSIPVENVLPDPSQVRKVFDDEKIDELAGSIRSRGLLNPIHVRPNNDGEYIIITGERRYRATRKADLPTINCIVHTENLSDEDIKTLQLVENLQRQDLSAIETAKGFHDLKEKGMTKRAIAASLGISESTVVRHVAIIDKIPQDWLTKIEETSADAPLTELYAIAKEKNQQKRGALYRKLMEKVGVEVFIKEPEQQEKQKSIKSDFSEEEIFKAWEALKRLKKGDITNLIKYIPPKRMQELIDLYE